MTGLLEQVQAGHTTVDVIVVDDRHRLPAGGRTSPSLVHDRSVTWGGPELSGLWVWRN